MGSTARNVNPAVLREYHWGTPMLRIKGKQKIFNYVITFLIKQGHPAMDEKFNCVLHVQSGDRAGDRCAVGCLIPDECYDPLLENLDVHLIQDRLLMKGELCKLPQFNDKYIDLLTELQEIHDDAAVQMNYSVHQDWPAVFFKELKKVAKKFKLNTKVLKCAKGKKEAHGT